MSHLYGQKYRVASRHPRHEHAHLKIIRWGLQQLEKQKIIKKDKKGEIENNYRYEIWLRTTDRALADEIRGKTLEVMNQQNPGRAWQLTEFAYKEH